MNRKAVIYARQSSGADDYSESVEVQIVNCRRLAEQMQIQVVDVFYDLNISGKTYPSGWETLAATDRAFQKWAAENTSGKYFRNGFGRILHHLSAIDYIIVDDITRLYRPLSRSFLESAVNQILIENHVQILQVKGGKLDLAQFDQQLVTMLKNQINDEQIAKQRQRSKEVLNKIRDSGIMPTGITAFALEYDKKNKTYIFNAERSQVVKYIFESLLADQPYCKILNTVNTRWNHLFKSCFWEKSVLEIARKPIYAGYQYNCSGKLIPNIQGNALITLEDFLKVQEIIKNRRLQSSRRNCNQAGIKRHWLPLSGLLYCGICGSKLVAAIEKGRISYFCRRGSLLKHEPCRGARIAMYCSKPYIVGAIETTEVFLQIWSAQHSRNCGTAGDNVQIHTAGKIAECEKRLQFVSSEFASGNLPQYVYSNILKKLNYDLQRYRTELFRSSMSGDSDEKPECSGKKHFDRWQYEELLTCVIKRIDVYNERAVFKTVMGEFELERKTVLRQKGFSQSKLTRLRKKLA